MNHTKFFIGALVLFILLSCNALTQPFSQEPALTAPPPNETFDCVDARPTQRDIDLALEYSEDFFSTPTWERSHEVLGYQVRVTWTSTDYGAVANFDHIIFCDVDDSVLDAFYTPANLDIIMENYDEHELRKQCGSNGQRLFEFNATKYGIHHNARLWVKIIDKDHTLQSLLVFPVEDTLNLDLYSRKIMPELPSCE